MAEPHTLRQAARAVNIGNRLWKVFEEYFPIKSTKPEGLFHYTNADGLKGIVESNSVWATDIEYLNDSSEMQDAEVLIDKVVEADKSEAIRKLGLSFGHPSPLLRALRTRERCFVFCLTEKRDQLTQWVQYAGLGGFALEFDQSILNPINPVLGEAVRNGRVMYNDRKKKEFIKGLLNEAKTCGDNYETIRRQIESVFRASQPLMKHNAFKAEKEWRVIIIPDGWSHAKVRVKGLQLIPYLEATYANAQLPAEGVPGLPCSGSNTRLPLKRVICGPGPHQDLSWMAARTLLNRRYSDVEVTSSKIPLRYLS